MKKIMLLIALMPMLCSCGASGRLLGSVARLPVDIVKAGTGTYDEGEAPPEYSDIMAEPMPLSHAP
ncbi:MAG: hypothetical protein ACRBDI_03225 [Alphaproteobacteria bacterium]